MRLEQHPRTDTAPPAHGRRPDRVLAVLVVLLILTLGAFAAGWTHYPFGVLVLVFLIIARVLHRKGRARPR